MTDLVKRLRECADDLARTHQNQGWKNASAETNIYGQAADTIERLEQELAEAKAGEWAANIVNGAAVKVADDRDDRTTAAESALTEMTKWVEIIATLSDEAAHDSMTPRAAVLASIHQIATIATKATP